MKYNWHTICTECVIEGGWCLDVKVMGSDESELTDDNLEPQYIVYGIEGSASSDGHRIMTYRWT